jgi:hypothetical protein
MNSSCADSLRRDVAIGGDVIQQTPPKLQGWNITTVPIAAARAFAAFGVCP